MNIKEIKCSTQNHENQKPYEYCIECNIFMCHHCFNNHQKNYNNHHLIDLFQNESKIFSYLCREDFNKLEYFCKSDAQLCCSTCKESKHKNCDIIKIEEIKEEKKINFDKNINELENISNKVKERINLIKSFYEKNNALKEDLKSNILKIITNLRNKLNEREDELLSEVDNIFSSIYPDEKLILNYEKIPKKINAILDKRNSLDEQFNDSCLLNSFINDCINIEKDFNEIQEIVELIDKYDVNKEVKLFFYPDKESEELNRFYEDIKSFGNIYQKENNDKFFYINASFKEIHELKSEIKKLSSELDKKDIKNDELQKEINSIKYKLNEELSKNNKLKNSKIKFTIRSRCALNKCLDMKSLTYGNSPHLWDYGHNNANQIFELEKNNDGSYSIKSSNSGLYLGIDSNKISFKWKNENRQSFYFHHFGDGYYVIQEKCGDVIDLYGGSTNNGNIIFKYSRHNGNNQQWKLVIHL